MIKLTIDLMLLSVIKSFSNRFDITLGQLAYFVEKMVLM